MDPVFEYTDKYEEKDDAVVRVWEKFFPYWPILLLLIIVAIGGAWMYLQYKPPLYEAKATVLIKDEKKGVDASKMAEGLNEFDATKIVENEIEVIGSRSIISQVVNDRHLYAPVFQRGQWISSSAYITSPVILEARNPAALRGEKTIEFTYNPKDSTIHVGYDTYNLNEWSKTSYGDVRFLPNEKYAAAETDSRIDTGKTFIIRLSNPKAITKNISRQLQAAPANKLASVITLSLKDEVPERSEDILNSIIAEYTRSTIKNKNSLADSTLAFVEVRLTKVTRELDSIERKLETYRAEKSAIDISSQGKLFLDNLSDNDKKVSEVEMQLAVLDQIESYVQSKNPTAEIVPSSLLVNDPLMNQRLEKLYDAESEYEKLKRTTAENNPALVAVVGQINRLKPGILESIRNQKLSLQAGKTNLTSTNDKYNSLLNGIPKKERDLIEISRQQAVKTNLFNFLSQKREEARLSQSSVIPDNLIVDKAEASLEPVAPNKMVFYLSAFFIAFILFVGLISARDIFHSTIYYRREIEKLTSIPILAEIPHEKAKSPIVIGTGKTNFAAEQFRKLRSSLGYLGITGKRKKILITSVIPGEGKSFIAANLGLSIALAGKKVLLLEFDLVNPGLSNKLGMITGKGISEYLSGRADPEEIIRQTPACEDLYIAGAGKYLPSSPSELIMNNRAAELIRYAEALFDYVIIDTPPVGLRSDAFTLSKFTDATLYVMRHKKTPKKSVNHIDETNKINELKNIAIVFNGVKPKGFGKNNYGYGYDYKYQKDSEKRKKKRIRREAKERI